MHDLTQQTTEGTSTDRGPYRAGEDDKIARRLKPVCVSRHLTFTGHSYSAERQSAESRVDISQETLGKVVAQVLGLSPPPTSYSVTSLAAKVPRLL